jgi:hypothetical protein
MIYVIEIYIGVLILVIVFIVVVKLVRKDK